MAAPVSKKESKKTVINQKQTAKSEPPKAPFCFNEVIDWNDEEALRAAFAELEEEERELANAGMEDYFLALSKLDGE